MKATPKDQIISLPNSSLRQASEPVNDINDQIKKVITDMKLATVDWEDHRKFEVGVALAAIQINKPYRIVIIREDFEDKSNHNFQVLIDPEIVSLSGKLVDDYEGCLSVKDIYGRVPRYDKIKIKAKDENGQTIKFSAKGFLARVLQHETDHLDGKLFIDHIKNNRKAFYKLDQEGQLMEVDYDKDIKQAGFFR